MTISPFSLRSAKGFTLMELVVVMAIIAILAAIAIPSYGAYTRKAHRADAQQFMMDMALRQGEILIDSRSYATAEEMADLLPVPDSISRYYTITSEASTEPTGFVITATAIGNQVDDGDLTLSNTGVKTPSDKW
ncbi:prepilin-type N-terminal cleavage/methylation domain-containing protein [Massilia sp. PAMC28688]|uniref:type IV pilin protein n=1 Tax=Massilia sp. PAMC28688 TaxID=2861283 RepID=UPI001C62763F|nr:type IV pilin protein [Massilia sp. PAMC28688]QYF92866.1 prepilin-type N-terminal cleavage/methylation domain-containing protein [Massilia sp. PAMC28688]